jgi:hypothetical protein
LICIKDFGKQLMLEQRAEGKRDAPLPTNRQVLYNQPEYCGNFRLLHAQRRIDHDGCS